MTTHIVIPVRDQADLTESICEQLLRQDGWGAAWIFDNGSTDRTWHYLHQIQQKDRRFFPMVGHAMGIYEMWDAGLRCSRWSGADNVAFLNNDLELAPNTISSMANVLDQNSSVGAVYPDYDLSVASGSVYSGLRYTSGTYRHGGMSGFCFMLRAAAVDWAPLVDPRFEWWGGDDDIAFNLEDRAWTQARLEGLPVDHLHEGTARHHDLGAVKSADMARIIDKWGR